MSGANLVRLGDPASNTFRVTLLDMADAPYGDCVLLQFGDTSVLIDGAHLGDDQPHGGFQSVPEQLADLFGHTPPFRVSLLIVTHPHADHVGCLPKLVAAGILQADWTLATDPKSRWAQSHDSISDWIERASDPSEAVLRRRLANALQEESIADNPDDAAIARFIDQADALQGDYKQVLDTLAQQGTHVVLYEGTSPTEVEQKFSSIGLKVLGPTSAQIKRCTNFLNKPAAPGGGDALTSALDRYQEFRAKVDSPDNEVALYRRLARALDLMDQPGPGAAINDLSIVASFEVGNYKLLFTGDMQLAKPEISGLNSDMKKLRQAIQDNGPYSFVKIPHHGSYNAFDEDLITETGSVRYGICAGSNDPGHPFPGTLQILNEHKGTRNFKWARTDRNGQVRITFGEKVTFGLTKGTINDPTPNTGDAPQPAQPPQPVQPQPALPQQPPAAPQQGPQSPVQQPQASTGEQVKVNIRIPHTTTRVIVSVDVQPDGISTITTSSGRTGGTGGTGEPTGTRPASGPDRFAPLNIAGGRPLDPLRTLLFATSAPALVHNIGSSETQHLLTGLRNAGLRVFDGLPSGLTDSAPSVQMVYEQLRSFPQATGVVLLGGYDVVPPQRVNALSSQLRAQLVQHVGQGYDPDDFIVWNDDFYGRRGDGSFVPVSRIPDGKEWELIRGAIEAGHANSTPHRNGVRNVKRPFAESVYSSIPGSQVLLVSEPTLYNQQNPVIDLDAWNLYFMLHGAFDDAKAFWGESKVGAQYPQAIGVVNVPKQFSGVVFAGCCWGALCTPVTASQIRPGMQPPTRVAGASIALSFLKAGAKAFVGCTGVHYSPDSDQPAYYGGPMHTAFWRNVLQGIAPAQALFNAKGEYRSGIPHGQNDPVDRAIELKILQEFTCLGLGW